MRSVGEQSPPDHGGHPQIHHRLNWLLWVHAIRAHAQQIDQLLSLQLCQPVLRRQVRVSFAQLHSEHIQKTTSPRMPTSAGQRADGKIMWFEWIKSGTHPVRLESTTRVAGAVTFAKALTTLVRDRAQKLCLSLCTRSANVAETQDFTRWCGISNDGIGQLRQIHFCAQALTDGAKAATMPSEPGLSFPDSHKAYSTLG